jgi:antirestriction protein ArdC
MSDRIYDMMTERIVALLEKGVIPWKRTWSGETEPQNLISKKIYRGINYFLLRCLEQRSAYFMTFSQAKKVGGRVRKGAKGYPVIFWKFDRYSKATAVEEDGEEKRERRSAPLLRYYTVFSVADIDGLPEGLVPVADASAKFEPLEKADGIVKEMPQRPRIKHEGARAFYRPSDDSVTMPQRETFGKPAFYYATLFHELTHSTGHESRLGRKSIGTAAFGEADYSREELVAEMGAGFLCATCNIENETVENSAAYIAEWLKVLRDDKRAVIVAAGQAQKAADFILGKTEKGA